MAAISSAHGAAATTLTPPTSSHGSNQDASWSYPTTTVDNIGRKKSISSLQSDRAHRSPNLAQNGFEPLGPPADRPTRKMQSSESFHADNNNVKSTYADLEGQSYHKSTEDQKRDAAQAGLVPGDDDKWIHRDKLARIESEELQAAGFFVPRSRAPSKQRRERSQVSYRRGTDASEQGHGRSRKNSAAVEQKPSTESNTMAWDLRTPEEIAEEEANAYFTPSTQKGGSRIPVAKSSLAPISTDHLERAQPVLRRHTDSSDGETLSYSKTRSRSASASGKDALGLGATAAASGKRSATDSSPKKATTGARKTSTPSRPPTTASTQPGRPKTRSGSGGTRPSTRSGEKQPEGDPPWLVDTYKPDPRLPPDQQLLPTVARRLRQEQWEKEGKAGDVFDKEFRPLNDNVFLRPPEAETGATDEELRSQDQMNGEWPLKPEIAAKSPTLRQGSYSTMPKIADKPPGSPLPSPRTPVPPQLPIHQQPQSTEMQPFQRVSEEEPEPKKGGCGCCIVM